MAQQTPIDHLYELFHTSGNTTRFSIRTEDCIAGRRVRSNAILPHSSGVILSRQHALKAAFATIFRERYCIGTY